MELPEVSKRWKRTLGDRLRLSACQGSSRAHTATRLPPGSQLLERRTDKESSQSQPSGEAEAILTERNKCPISPWPTELL